MRLAELSLNDTPVFDLSPLRGMPLVELRLVNTKVRDVSPLRGAPIQNLWLNNTPASDLGPLAGAPLVSLTIEGTQVRDLAFVESLPSLERLNLAGSQVDDLSPVAGLRLSRLVFTPSRITKGLDAARTLPVCREMGPSLEQMSPPQTFWAAYDSGAFK
jgi:Leucine-rich repeat (LRR) protein